MAVFSEFLEFMIFSMIESFAIVAIMLAMFRFKVTNYFWPAILLVFIMSLQSYVLREEFSSSALVPIINLILLVFFTMHFIRVSLIWSAVISAFGSVFAILVQVTLVALSGETIEWFTTVPTREYFMQLLTGVICISTGFLLYKFGIGLSFPFEKLRFKWERILIYIFIGIIVVSFGVLASLRSIYIDIVFLLISLLLFI